MAVSLGGGYGGAMTDPTTLPNFPPPADEHPLRGRVLDVLKDLGLRPDIDSDGDVAFTVQAQQLFVRCMDGDCPVMRMFGQWLIGEQVPGDLYPALRCNDSACSSTSSRPAWPTTPSSSPRARRHEQSDIPALGHVSMQLVLAGVQMWHEKIMGRRRPRPGRRRVPRTTA